MKEEKDNNKTSPSKANTGQAAESDSKKEEIKKKRRSVRWV